MNDEQQQTESGSVERGVGFEPAPPNSSVSPADSACCSPGHHVVFHSASQSPTHTASDFEDARSDLPEATALLNDAMPPPPPPMPPPKPTHLHSQDSFNEIRRAPDHVGSSGGLKRRFSRGSAAPTATTTSQSRSHSRSHSRRVSDFSDMELPPLEALFGHHLHFHPEEDGATPDENDLFPSTPLDEDQLQHADNRLKEQLGDVVINKIEEVGPSMNFFLYAS